MGEVEHGMTLAADITALELLAPDGERVSVGSLVADSPTVFVFLRHFGCLACQEHVALWKPRLAEFASAGAVVIFIGNGDAKQLREFVQKTGLVDEPAAAYTDPEKRFYDVLGMENSLASVLSPGAMFNAVRALGRGHLQTSVQGDPTQQGGVLIVDAAKRVQLLHREARLGDYLPVEEALAKVKELA